MALSQRRRGGAHPRGLRGQPGPSLALLPPPRSCIHSSVQTSSFTHSPVQPGTPAAFAGQSAMETPVPRPPQEESFRSRSNHLRVTGRHGARLPSSGCRALLTVHVPHPPLKKAGTGARAIDDTRTSQRITTPALGESSFERDCQLQRGGRGAPHGHSRWSAPRARSAPALATAPGRVPALLLHLRPGLASRQAHCLSRGTYSLRDPSAPELARELMTTGHCEASLPPARVFSAAHSRGSVWGGDGGRGQG